MSLCFWVLVPMSLGMMECMNQHGMKMDSSLWTFEPRSLWCARIKWWFITFAWKCNQKLDDWYMVRIPSITADRIQGVRWCSICGLKRLQVYFPAHQTAHYLDFPIKSYAYFSNCYQKLKDARTSHEIHWCMRMLPFTPSWTSLSLYISCTIQWKVRFWLAEFRIHKLVEFCLCVSLERLATLVLSIPEGVVERRTAVHPVRAFTSIGRDCVGCFVGTWKGDCLGSSSRGQPRGALPLHQVTQRQVIKFADPTRRSGHTTCYTRCIGVCASSGTRASVYSLGLFLFLVG